MITMDDLFTLHGKINIPLRVYVYFEVFVFQCFLEKEKKNLSIKASVSFLSPLAFCSLHHSSSFLFRCPSCWGGAHELNTILTG